MASLAQELDCPVELRAILLALGTDHDHMHRQIPDQRARRQQFHRTAHGFAAIKRHHHFFRAFEDSRHDQNRPIQRAHHPFQIGAQMVTCLMGCFAAHTNNQQAHVMLQLSQYIHQGTVALVDGEEFGVRGITLRALATPGHTDGCMSYVTADQTMVFTGDTLLIRGCGRSDFQQGSPRKLYHSITARLFNLPDSCLVYPAHDYQGRTVSTIGEEKAFNVRVGDGANETDFIEFMQAMKLPHPKLIDEAVPANLRSGRPEDGRLPTMPVWADIHLTYGGVPEIAADWLEEHLNDVTVLDVRLDEEVRDCPLSGQLVDIHIPLDQLRGRVAELPRDKPVVALCRSGRRSALAVTILSEAGFDKVASLSHGLKELTQI